MRSAPTFPTEQINVIAWPDDVIDTVGHDARAHYVERYWLGILGPSTTFLLRQIADQLEVQPNGFVLDYREAANRIGIQLGGKHSAFMRSMGRLVQFELAQLHAPTVLAVRRRVPTLSRRHIARLDDHLRQQHDAWQQRQLHTRRTPVA
jgi:hypothetical protein